MSGDSETNMKLCRFVIFRIIGGAKDCCVLYEGVIEKEEVPFMNREGYKKGWGPDLMAGGIEEKCFTSEVLFCRGKIREVPFDEGVVRPLRWVQRPNFVGEGVVLLLGKGCEETNITEESIGQDLVG